MTYSNLWCKFQVQNYSYLANEEIWQYRDTIKLPALNITHNSWVGQMWQCCVAQVKRVTQLCRPIRRCPLNCDKWHCHFETNIVAPNCSTCTAIPLIIIARWVCNVICHMSQFSRQHWIGQHNCVTRLTCVTQHCHIWPKLSEFNVTHLNLCCKFQVRNYGYLANEEIGQ